MPPVLRHPRSFFGIRTEPEEAPVLCFYPFTGRAGGAAKDGRQRHLHHSECRPEASLMRTSGWIHLKSSSMLKGNSILQFAGVESGMHFFPPGIIGNLILNSDTRQIPLWYCKSMPTNRFGGAKVWNSRTGEDPLASTSRLGGEDTPNNALEENYDSFAAH